jgi:hypothetical protein
MLCRNMSSSETRGNPSATYYQYFTESVGLQSSEQFRHSRHPHTPILGGRLFRGLTTVRLEKSVSLDPLQTTAMEYLSHTIGGKWLERLYDARSERAQAFLAGAESVASDSGDRDSLLKTYAWVATLAPPLPPPPPPPPRVGNGMGSSSSGISFDPRIVTSNEPPPIRVASAVQARKLISKADPEAPADWPEEPSMRFVVVIGNDGRIVREVLISGNPWLTQTAVAALREWVYEPTLVNEKPVAAVTEVRIEFRRGRE